MKKFLLIFLTVCMVVSCMIVPSFAADYPDFSDYRDHDFVMSYYDGNNFPTIVFIDFQSEDKEFVSSVQEIMGVLSIEIRPSNSLLNYTICRYENNKWNYIDSGNSMSSKVISNVKEIVYSSSNLYTSNGDLFFQAVPLLVKTVEELTMEQSMAVQNQTVGVMKILVPCGVGCLALLMALPTLRKGFLRFLH